MHVYVNNVYSHLYVRTCINLNGLYNPKIRKEPFLQMETGDLLTKRQHLVRERIAKRQHDRRTAHEHRKRENIIRYQHGKDLYIRACT